MTDQNAPPMPEPTTEHRLLRDHVGTWNVACKFYMEPGQPPMESKATEAIEMVGDFWTISKFQSEVMGAPFVGRATMGYDPHTGRYVSTWIDSMSPVLFHLTGTKKGDTITMEGNAFSCMTKSVLKHRTTLKYVGKNEQIFEMFCTMPDGKEIKMMTNHYRRA
jgi:hypothetical protein